ncbi:F-box/WD repeat-containing protein 9-like, partial [Saccoglossus kowalevskii]
MQVRKHNLYLSYFASVDAVHLMQDGDICLSGSRDRSVAIWDLRKLDNWSPSQSTSKVKVKTLENHKGWVWAVTSFNNTLCTASWDCKVKLWDMQAGGVEIQNFSGKSANLCTSFKEHSLIVGSYDKRVTIYDPR